jgi:hypothetical protein
VSVTLGLLIDQHLLRAMPSLNDPLIPSWLVHTTCERCGIMDCKERAAAPEIITKAEKEIRKNDALRSLDQ